MDGSGKARRGDKRIPARVWNRMVDAADIVHRTLQQDGGAPGEILRAKNIVLVRNDSGEDVERGGVLAISGILTDPSISSTAKESFFDVPTLIGVTPTNESRDFGILLGAIKSGDIGRVAIGGAVSLRVDVIDDGHTRADVKAATAAMRSSAFGPVRLLWKEPGTGDGRWALGVIVASEEIIFGKTTAFWSPYDSSAGVGGQAYIDVADVIGSGDVLLPGSPPQQVLAMNLLMPVASDKYVVLKKVQNLYYLVSAEC